jgi:hypothetical protein
VLSHTNIFFGVKIPDRVIRQSLAETKDWNKEFQLLLEKDDNEAKFTKLRHLANDFVYVGSLHRLEPKLIKLELTKPPCFQRPRGRELSSLNCTVTEKRYRQLK